MELNKYRLSVVKQWRTWADDLESDEDKLHRAMERKVASIMKPKRVLLLKKIAESFEWVDESVFNEMVEGFMLTGMPNPSGLFPTEVNVPSMTPDQLDDQYSVLKPIIWKSIETSKPDKDVWDATMIEAEEKGWLEGPLRWDELERRFPEGWAPVRRFGIVQSGKVRVIDDFSENETDLAYASQEKLDLRALDHLAWCAAFMASCIHVKGVAELRLQDGTFLSGPVHPDWFRVQPKLVTKTVDLKSAYKQLPLHPLERKRSVITAKSPVDNCTYGFVNHVLPFGASSAVLAFNRVSRLLWRVLISAGIICTCYFDDFPILDVGMTSLACDNLIRSVMRILGFKCSEDKELGFNERTEMLGVVLDTTQSVKGDILISNKPSRVVSLTQGIQDLIDAKQVRSRDVPKIFGRLQFAEHQLSGRVGKLAMAELRKLDDSKKDTWYLDEKAIEELKLLKFRLCEHPPRTLNFCDERNTVQVFTDGACGPDEHGRYSATVGGVIFVDGKSEYFGGTLPDELVLSWLTNKEHIIGLVELYAVGGSLLAGRKVVYYIDNLPAMRALIKGTSSDPHWRDVLRKFEEAEMDAQSFSWFARVPSASNIADGPSRGDDSLLVGSTKVVPKCLYEGCPIREPIKITT